MFITTLVVSEKYFRILGNFALDEHLAKFYCHENLPPGKLHNLNFAFKHSGNGRLKIGFMGLIFCTLASFLPCLLKLIFPFDIGHLTLLTRSFQIIVLRIEAGSRNHQKWRNNLKY